VEATLGSPFAVPGDGVLTHRDLPVDATGDARRRFDLHLPNACAGGGLPLVVWIGGDDTWSGTRADCPLRWLVARGYAVACVGYRPAGTAVFPAQLDDCRAAIATLVRDADTWGVDPARVCVMGRGAGGHLAALVALADPAAGAAETAAPAVVAAGAIAAPTDLPSLGPAHVRSTSAASLLVGGPLPEFREAAQRASPLTHVSSDAPPFLIIHAKGRDGDPAVPIEQSRQFDEALRAAGVKSTLVVIDKPATKSTLVSDSRVAEPLAEFLRRSFHRSGGR
jgi:acetyl esterase/lipase